MRRKDRQTAGQTTDRAMANARCKNYQYGLVLSSIAIVWCVIGLFDVECVPFCSSLIVSNSCHLLCFYLGAVVVDSRTIQYKTISWHYSSFAGNVHNECYNTSSCTTWGHFEQKWRTDHYVATFYTVSQKRLIYTLCLRMKVTLFIFVYIYISDVSRFCQFLAETYPREFATKHRPISTAHLTRFYTLELYFVIPATIFIAFHAVSNMKSPQQKSKSNIKRY